MSLRHPVPHAVAVWYTSTAGMSETLSNYLSRRNHNLCYWLPVHVFSCYGVLQCTAACCSVLQCDATICFKYMLFLTLTCLKSGCLSGMCMINQARMFLKIYYHAVADIYTYKRSLYMNMCMNV